ncbi:MAG: DNA-processing protein DprA [Pelagimonas sp.]
MRDNSYSSTHPPLPPTTEDLRVSWLRLLRSRRVGVSTFWRLLSEHKHVDAALEALPQVAKDAGVNSYRICPMDVAQAEIEAGHACGARLVCCGDYDYPSALSHLPDAPPLLWVRGGTAVLRRPMVALVGARNASSLGTRMARALSRGLGEAGFVVVSGLARGVDTAAHIETVKTGTVAVMAGGVDVMYPAENGQLARDILDQDGALVSEQPIGMQPQARHFPVRNRIVSGMARAVVVVEAAAKSGSLITARTALDQGRDVMAVPGHPMDARASGCNFLIRDGAVLVRNVEDIIEALAPAEDIAPELPLEPANPPAVIPAGAPQTRSLRETADLHRQILDRLGPSPVAEDQLTRDLGASAAQMAPALTDLELEGRVHRQPGGLLSLAPRAGSARIS